MALSEDEKLAIRWLKGEVTIDGLGDIKFNDKQKEFCNNKSRFNLISGGMASGKTMSYVIKFILFARFFPGSYHLIGRKTKENAQDTFMKDFIEICPPGIYEHQKGYGKIIFNNGSIAEFWGLDALQSGATTDIKKAEQKLKSHNFSFIWLDQLEEIEKKVFDALNSRMRHRQCNHAQDLQEIFYDKKSKLPIFEICKHPDCGKPTFNQINCTTNPANYWGYDFFKVNPSQFTHLTETSMMDNKKYLSEQFIQSELLKPKRYVQKYVYGEWSPDSLTDSAVFSEDYIKEQEFYIKSPVREFDGIKIFEEPASDQEYQIGVDPSDGSVDPCSIKVISLKTGNEVASYSAFVPHSVIANKAVMIALMYSLKSKPLIIPECTGAGQALVEYLKPIYDNIYQREIFSMKENKKINKLGFSTNYATKKLLIENMTDLFQKKFPKIRDRKTLEELKTFIYTNEVSQKGASAQNGYHDDNIMGLMLAYWGVKPKPINFVEEEVEEMNLYSVTYH